MRCTKTTGVFGPFFLNSCVCFVCCSNYVRISLVKDLPPQECHDTRALAEFGVTTAALSWRQGWVRVRVSVSATYVLFLAASHTYVFSCPTEQGQCRQKKNSTRNNRNLLHRMLPFRPKRCHRSPNEKPSFKGRDISPYHKNTFGCVRKVPSFWGKRATGGRLVLPGLKSIRFFFSIEFLLYDGFFCRHMRKKNTGMEKQITKKSG